MTAPARGCRHVGARRSPAREVNGPPNVPPLARRQRAASRLCRVRGTTARRAFDVRAVAGRHRRRLSWSGALHQQNTNSRAGGLRNAPPRIALIVRFHCGPRCARLAKHSMFQKARSRSRRTIVATMEPSTRTAANDKRVVFEAAHHEVSHQDGEMTRRELLRRWGQRGRWGLGHVRRRSSGHFLPSAHRVAPMRKCPSPVLGRKIAAARCHYVHFSDSKRVIFKRWLL